MYLAHSFASNVHVLNVPTYLLLSVDPILLMPYMFFNVLTYILFFYIHLHNFQGIITINERKSLIKFVND